MRRRQNRRGFNDPFPRLPPGVTPSDIPGNRPQDVPPDERPDAEPDEQPCMVCRPPHNSTDLLDRYDDLSRLPFCDDHDPDDLRARWERDEGVRNDRLQDAYEADPTTPDPSDPEDGGDDSG